MKQILRLEETIKDMRIAYARQFCQCNDIGLELSDEDYLGIYNLLLTKAQKNDIINT